MMHWADAQGEGDDPCRWPSKSGIRRADHNQLCRMCASNTIITCIEWEGDLPTCRGQNDAELPSDDVGSCHEDDCTVISPFSVEPVTIPSA